MRGKVFFAVPHILPDGITPAYAGKSSLEKRKGAFGKDHPRLCGEKWYNNRRGELYVGSPPPMRGKVQVILNRFTAFGITPAYAGKRHH